MKLFLHLIFFSLIFTNLFLTASDKSIETNLTKGISIVADDSSFALKFGIVIQPRLEFYDSLNSCKVCDDTYNLNWELRRLRFKFEGFFGSPELTYFIQLGVTNKDMEAVQGTNNEITGIIYDAYVDWEFLKKSKLRLGQFKLPGSFSRLMTFQGLNFLERSYSESKFNTYRDIGLQLINEWNISDFFVREFYAFTHGEGVNQKTIMDGGYAYSGRIELYPLGLFDKKGETFEFDKAFENKPKLMIGGSAFYDDEAHRERGNLGKSLYGVRDIKSYFLSFLLKYAGWGLQSEYSIRQCSGNAVTYNLDSSSASYVYVGSGYDAILSYMITDDMALAFRYSFVKPDDNIIRKFGERTDYSLGFTKFLFSNQVKIQADVSYIDESKFDYNNIKTIMARTNLIVSF